MSSYQRFIAASRYARFLPDKQRRETWKETVTRYCNFFKEKYPEYFPYDEVFEAIHNLEVMPSMRALMTAGKALDRDNVAGYNCSYIAVDDPRAFDEALYILMCGTGLGFSVERQFIAKLPEVAEEFHPTDTVIKVKDSKIGWASSLRELIGMLYSGHLPKWDLTALRPSGAPLKTFGGRSSGPQPLADLFDFAVSMFKRAAGRKLTSTECHDLMCKIADVVVVGGVRRSALISLSNLSDDRMRHAKSGQWWLDTPHRALSNNSVAYTEKPEIGQFMEEWLSLYNSKSGERGIFNRVAAKRKIKSLGDRRKPDYDFGANPCVSGDMMVQLKLDNKEEYYHVSVTDAVNMFYDGVSYSIRSKNIETNEMEYKPVSAAALTRESAEVLEIIYDENKPPLVCTPDHKVMTKNRGWVEAQHLVETDELDFV
jgi:ribonucleoside-diphosphate reductase alpha chain